MSRVRRAGGCNSHTQLHLWTQSKPLPCPETARAGGQKLDEKPRQGFRSSLVLDDGASWHAHITSTVASRPCSQSAGQRTWAAAR